MASIPIMAMSVVTSMLAFIYGVKSFCRKGVALYFQLLTFAVGCYMMGCLFNLFCIIFIGEFPTPFHVGYLGYAGCFIFLFSASHGEINGIVDDGSPEMRKYRYFGLLGPFLMMFPLVACGMSAYLSTMNKIVVCIACIPAILGSYYNCKLFWAPDHGFAFLREIRPCHIPPLIVYLSVLGQLYFDLKAKPAGVWLCAIITLLALIALMFFSERGRKRWTI